MRRGRITNLLRCVWTDPVSKALSRNRKPSHEEDVEESGPSSARVRITAVSLGQSLSAVGGMLAFRARTGPVTPSNPSVTTCSPTFSRRMAGGASCSTTSTHHFSSMSAYLIPHSPMAHRPRDSHRSPLPVVGPPVVVVQPRLVLARDIDIRIIGGRLLDPLLVDVDHDHFLLGGHRAEPGRGQQHLATRQPAARVDDEIAGLEVRVAQQNVDDVSDLAIGGQD